MFDNNLFNHQKLNYEITYKFRNKYFVLFPFYLFFLFNLCLISTLFKFILRNNIKIESHVFFTFSRNQLKIKNLFKDNNINFHFNFRDFKVNSSLFRKNQNLYFFGLVNSLSLSTFFKIFRINDYKFFKMNWFRICNLIFIEPILQKLINKNKLVIVSNDHSINNNFIINWCKINGIETMYIQHAPVTKKFPQLRCDYNILFSKSSEKIYSKISKIRVNYKVYSDFRLFKFLNLNNKYCFNKKTILICTNELDDIQSVKKYIDFFIPLNYKITIRKHPADRRNWVISNTILSKNDLYEDFSINNVILCNETALILEGIICNKLIYKCNFSAFFDNYGYLKEGLILKEYNNPEALLNDLNNNYISYERSKLNYYVGDLENYKDHILEINNFLKTYNSKKNE